MSTQDGILSDIIVVKKFFGVNTQIREVTEQIAKRNYVAITPAIY